MRNLKHIGRLGVLVGGAGALTMGFFIDWSGLFQESKYSYKSSAEESADIRLNSDKSIVNNGDVDDSESNEQSAQYEEALRKSIRDSNAAKKVAVVDNMEAHNYKTGGFVIGEHVLKFGEGISEDTADGSASINAEAACIQCPGMDDTEFENRLRAVLKEIGIDNLVAGGNSEDKERKLRAFITEDGTIAYLDDTPVFLDENGVLIDPVTGMPIKHKGRILTVDDLDAQSDLLLNDENGTIYSADGARLAEDVIGLDDLEGMTYDGKAVYVDENGQLRYADGSPVLDENGEAVFFDPVTRQFTDSKGNKSKLGDKLRSADGDLVVADGIYRKDNSAATKDKKLSAGDLKGMTYDGKAVYVDENGQLRYADGSPVLDENGNEIFYDEEKGFVDANGNPSATGTKLRTEDGDIISGNSVLSTGTAKSRLTEGDLEGMTYDGKAVYVDENGQLRYADGSPVLDENGNEIFYDEEKGFVDKDGNPSATGVKLRTVDNGIIKGNSVLREDPSSELDLDSTFGMEKRPLEHSDLTGMTYNGKPVYVDENGQLRYADGSPVLDENGNAVFYDEEKGFVDKVGTPSNLNTTLRDSEGNRIAVNGGKSFQELTEEQARMIALQAAEKAKQRKEQSEVVQVQEGETGQTGTSNEATPTNKTLGLFLVAPNGDLLSSSAESLLLESIQVNLENEGDPNLGIKWSGSSSAFENTSQRTGSIIFKGAITGKLYDAQGNEIIAGQNLFYVNENNALMTAGGGTYFNNKRVYVADNELLKTEDGDSITTLNGASTLKFNKNIGVNAQGVDENQLLGVLSNAEGKAVDHLGVALKNDRGRLLLDGLDYVRFLPNGTIIKQAKPIYSADLERLVIAPEEVNGVRQISIKDMAGQSFQNLNIRSVDKILTLHKEATPIDVTSVFVFSRESSRIPLISTEIAYELLGLGGLYVSNDGYVFSGQDKDQVVVSSDFTPYIFQKGVMLNQSKLIPPQLDYSIKSNNEGVVLNIDGGYLFTEGMPLELSSAGTAENIDLSSYSTTLYPTIGTTPEEMVDEYIKGAAFSSSGRLYKANKPLTTALGGLLIGRKGEPLQSSGSNSDAPINGNSNVTIYHGLLSTGEELIANKKQVIESSGYQITAGRLVQNGEVVIQPQLVVTGYNAPLIANNKVLNIDSLAFDRLIGEIGLIDGVFVSKDGGLIMRDGIPLRVLPNGKVVNAETGAEVEGTNGPLFFDKSKGFVNRSGQKNEIDYLETTLGERLDAQGNKLKKGELSKRVNYDNFLFDDQDYVYTGDGIPVIAEGQHLKLKDGKLHNDSGMLKYNEAGITLADDGLKSLSGGDIDLAVNEEGKIIEKSTLQNAKDLLSSIFDDALTPDERMRSGFNKQEIDAVDYEVNEYGENYQAETAVSRDDSDLDATEATPTRHSFNKLAVNEAHSLLSNDEALNILGYDKATIEASVQEIKRLVDANFMIERTGSLAAYVGEDDSVPNADQVAEVANEAEDASFTFAEVTALPDNAMTIFKKGTKVKARITTPYSTASGGNYKPMARIVSGPLRGAVVKATNLTASSTDIVMVFGSTITLPNGTRIEGPQNYGVSLDIETGYPGSGAEVESHLLKRIALLTPLAMLGKVGDFIEATKQTVSSQQAGGMPTGVENTTTETATAKELTRIVAGEGATMAQEVVQSTLDDLTREIKLWEGQDIEIMFMEDVIINSDKL